MLAQEWMVEASAGATTHEGVAADVGTRSAMLGVRSLGDQWVLLTAGLPLEPDGVSWAAVGAGGSLSLPGGAFDLGLDWAGLGHGYRLSDLAAFGTGLTLSALPRLGVAAGPTRVELFTGPLLYRQSFEGSSTSESSSRTFLDSGVRARVSPSATLLLSADVRYLHSQDGGHPYGGAGVSYATEQFNLWGSAGSWDLGEDVSTSWAVGASVGLVGGFSLRGSIADESADPIYWNTPRRTWSLGVERSFGSRPAALPVPMIAEAAGGLIDIRIPASAASTAPSLAGDFTGWQPVAMVLEGREWVARVTLEPGVYRYAFVDTDGTWFVPDHLPRVDDGMGGESAVLVVP